MSQHTLKKAIAGAATTLTMAVIVTPLLTAPSYAAAPTVAVSVVTPVPGSKAAIAVAYAKSKISSAQYLWGGEGPTRFDCSGLTMMAWRAAGVNIPHNSTEQLNFSPKVSRADIKPGDLVIWTFSSYADHVSMYVGPMGPNGEDLIDTATRHPGGGVNWSSMATRGGVVAGIVRPAPWTGGTTPAPSPTPVPTPAPAPSTVKYTVKSGDTLSKIAASHGTTWQKLYAANKATIGSNPNLIYPGQVLSL